MPVSAASARAEAQKVLSTTHWARTGSCSMRISRVGPPCWECRASSVWIEEIMLAKLTSPEASASAASATNCRLVKPVSNTSGSCSAMSTTLAELIIASNMLRSEIATQSLVWNAFCVQSYCGSLLMNSCPKNVVIDVCRSSSSAPKTAMFRHDPASPNRAILSSASVAAYSLRETPPKCILVADFQPSSRPSQPMSAAARPSPRTPPSPSPAGSRRTPGS